MKVLMFGWEFPPHIAGGLGTACYGMTKGLAHCGVDVLFVMPSASGDEDQSSVRIINASDVAVSDTCTNVDEFLSKVQFLRVGSNLHPYMDPTLFTDLVESERRFQSEEFKIHFGQKYKFSGKYGSNLMEEVSRYAMVVFEKGKPKKSDYRKFKIKTVTGPDDYSCMREALTRRFTHGMEENEELARKDMDASFGSFSKYPDLLLMDGGRGQVNIALEVLESLGLNVPVCGMVKDDFHRTRGIYFNNVELPIDIHSEGFKLVTRIQDEAHRFAIEYHKSLRSKVQESLI